MTLAHNLLQQGMGLHPNGGIFPAIEVGWDEPTQIWKHERKQEMGIPKGKNSLSEIVLQKPRYYGTAVQRHRCWDTDWCQTVHFAGFCRSQLQRVRS